MLKPFFVTSQSSLKNTNIFKSCHMPSKKTIFSLQLPRFCRKPWNTQQKDALWFLFWKHSCVPTCSKFISRPTHDDDNFPVTFDYFGSEFFFEAAVALVKSNHISLTCNYQNELVIELRVDNKVIIIIKSPKPILTKVS